MFSRQKMGVIMAELLGTAILAMVAIGASRYFNFTAPWYIAIAVGFTLMVLVTTIGRVSGSHVNPAITLGLWSLRKIDTPQAIVYISAQLLGGALAFAFIEYVTNSDIVNAGLSSFDLRIFVAEMVGAAVFGFGVAAVVMQKIEGAQAALTVGFSLTLGVLVAAVAAPGFINPAVALASNAWDSTVILAPILGSIVGMNVYSFFLAPTESLQASKKKKK